MSDIVAVLLAHGTGQSDTSALNAFDAALHDGGGAALANINLVQVSSIVPPGAQVCRLRPGAEADAAGLIAHAVVSRADTVAEVVSAGIGLAAPPDPATCGMIFELHGLFDGPQCQARLEAMTGEGMLLRGAGYGKWRTHTAVATSRPGPASRYKYRCAVAAVVLLDAAAMAIIGDAAEAA